jgi:ATP-dependent Clp protease ATP-binding subunit ClpC
MFERYTEAARRALFFARYEVTQLGGMTIEPEHLLLGLLRKPQGLIGRIFDVGRVSPSALQLAIEEQVTRGERVSTSVEIPFSEATKRVLAFAAEEADRVLHSHIGTEHLLLGVLREERSTAAATLGVHGITLAETRETIVGLLRETPAPAGGPSIASGERVELVRRLGADLEQLASDLDIARERLRRIAAALETLGRDMTSE